LRESSADSKSAAYLLVAHGSRDLRSQLALTQLADLFRDSSQNYRVGTAVLEFGEVSLDQQIVAFAGELEAGDRLEILPIFLLPGVHVQEDLPAAIDVARPNLPKGLEIILHPHLGAHAGMAKLLTQQMSEHQIDAWILLSHGSRRAAGNQAIAQLSQRIGAHPAYWSIAPSLAEVVTRLIASGHKQIGILPYFLFAGKTTDGINQAVQELRLQFPQVSLDLAHSLQPTVELATILLDLCQSDCPTSP
jgi:sirohydrochlorin ferrochelatase